jgi:hypothetical protein
MIALSLSIKNSDPGDFDHFRAERQHSLTLLNSLLNVTLPRVKSWEELSFDAMKESVPPSPLLSAARRAAPMIQLPVRFAKLPLVPSAQWTLQLGALSPLKSEFNGVPQEYPMARSEERVQEPDGPPSCRPALPHGCSGRAVGKKVSSGIMRDMNECMRSRDVDTEKIQMALSRVEMSTHEVLSAPQQSFESTFPVAKAPRRHGMVIKLGAVDFPDVTQTVNISSGNEIIESKMHDKPRDAQSDSCDSSDFGNGCAGSSCAIFSYDDSLMTGNPFGPEVCNLLSDCDDDEGVVQCFDNDDEHG